DGHVADGAQKKAGVREADGSTTDCRALKIRKSSLRRAEIVLALRARVVVAVVALPSQVGSKLVCVIVFDPGQTGCRRGLLVEQVAIGVRAHVFHSTLRVGQTSEVGKQPIDRSSFEPELF